MSLSYWLGSPHGEKLKSTWFIVVLFKIHKPWKVFLIGDRNNKSYIDTHDEAEKMAYHLINNPQWDDPEKKAFWDKWLLWTSKDIDDSLDIIDEKYKLTYLPNE